MIDRVTIVGIYNVSLIVTLDKPQIIFMISLSDQDASTEQQCHK